MTFSAIFANSLAGISAASFRAEILSFNIANANTEGFARRSVNLQSVTPGGVRVIDVEAADAGREELRLLAAHTNAAGAEVRADALRALNVELGEPGDPNGLYAVFTRFEEALADLRLTPESGAGQLAYLRAAEDVTQAFARVDSAAQNMRLDADRAIGATVTRINDALVELQSLNEQANRPVGPGADNIAERQRSLLTEIAQALDVNIQGEVGSALTIRTAGGILLLGERANSIDFTPAGSASFELTLANGDFSGLSVNGLDITPGSRQGVREGSLAGQFAVRDVLGQDLATRLDVAAADLADRSQSVELVSSPGLFILQTGTSSAAQRIAVNPLADPDQGGELFRLRDGMSATVPGDAAGQGILADWQSALEELRVLTLATNTPQPVSFRDALGGIATAQATAALRADGLGETATAAVDVLSTDVARIVGVDTDQELQELLLVEQAFAANARVVQVADDMLATLLEL